MITYHTKTRFAKSIHILLLCAVVFSAANLFACTQQQKSDENIAALFETLTGESVHDAVYNALLNREASCDLSSFQLSENDFSNNFDFQKLLDENPHIDYVDRYTWHSQSQIITQLTFEYQSVPSDYKKRLEAALDLAIDSIKKQLQENYRQVELVCAISDYIAINCQYAYKSDGQTPDDAASNVYSAFLDSRAICDGYASAFTLLAQQFGLEVIKVSGIAGPGNDSHAWNMAKVDGTWYHVDVTWNDPTPDTPGYAGHKYLLLSDAAMSAPRSGSNSYHASWDANAPRAEDTRYDDAFWVHEDAPISFVELHYEQWEQLLAQTTFEDVIARAVENNAEANVARFGYDAKTIEEQIRKLYPYIGYTYAQNSDGIVIKIANWVLNN